MAGFNKALTLWHAFGLRVIVCCLYYLLFGVEKEVEEQEEEMVKQNRCQFWCVRSSSALFGKTLPM